MPTYAEIMRLLGFKSKNAAYKVVQKLIDQGLIEKDSHGRLLPGKIGNPLKILGLVEAGFPTQAEEDLAETMSLDSYLIGNREATFMLKVSGESMIEAGINPGEMIIVERTAQCKDGDIIVAFIDGGYTVKYFRKRGNKIWLDPANKDFTPIVPAEGEELQVMAVVRAVIRKY